MPTEPTPYPLPPIPTSCAGNCIDDLLVRLEKLSDACSLSGVAMILHPSDVWTLIEWVKNLTAERNVLRETLDHITFETDNFRDINTISIYGETVLKKLYERTAPTSVEYVQHHQE